MTRDELTKEEKVKLLAHKDMGNSEDYDEELYKLLQKPDVPPLEDLDDHTRRAIAKFISFYYETWLGNPLEHEWDDEVRIKAGFTILLLRGYELGRKLRRPLTAKRVRR